jgi:hypothetical protein
MMASRICLAVVLLLSLAGCSAPMEKPQSLPNDCVNQCDRDGGIGGTGIPQQKLDCDDAKKHKSVERS